MSVAQIAGILGAIFGGGSAAAIINTWLNRRKIRIEPMLDVQGAALKQMEALRLDLDDLRKQRDADNVRMLALRQDHENDRIHIGRLERRVDQLIKVIRDSGLAVPGELPDPEIGQVRTA